MGRRAKGRRFKSPPDSNRRLAFRRLMFPPKEVFAASLPSLSGGHL